MPRWTKIALQILGTGICLVVLFWIGVAIYVQSHKKELLSNITAQLNNGIKGTLAIESMEPALIRGFPGISVSLNNVLLKDSLWEKHNHTLLEAKNVYIAINAFSIISGNPEIKNIEISNGKIYIYTDSLGTSNTDLFKKKTTESKKDSGGKNRINRVDLKNVSLTYQDDSKRKLIRLKIDEFLGSINYRNSGWKANLRLQTKVNDLMFNTLRGSFLKEKYLDADLDLEYNEKQQRLTIPTQEISLDNTDITIGGKLQYGTSAPTYDLQIGAPEILLKDAVSLLSPNIGEKLKPYALTKPVDARASISGALKQSRDPHIRITWKTSSNTLTALGETITDCSFSGSFDNEVKKGAARKSPNSAVAFYDLKGKWHEIPFKADSILILDLKNPVFSGRFHADFALRELNKVFGDNSFEFSGGTAALNILYKAPYNKSSNSARSINGTISIKDGEANYKPRGINFKKVGITLNFTGQDLLLQRVSVQSGSNSLSMEGSVRNFANLYYTDPKKILFDLQVKSPRLNLNEFLVFLGKRKTSVSSGNKLSGLSKQLDLMLTQASIRMRVDVARVLYKKFEGTNVKADITMREGGIDLGNISLSQGGGRLILSGDIDQTRQVNLFNIKSDIRNINVQKLFYAFENFGQNAITDRNLQGTFYGSTAVTGAMRDDGSVVPGSFQGLIQFDIRNGALLNFEPLQKAGAFAFPNRDFTNITFKNLKNTLDLKGSKVYIRPMRIETSVLNVFLEGVYGFTSGTNIALQVPLRDPKKDAGLSDYGPGGRFTKGIIINLRAVEEEGKVKFKLGKG